MVVSGVGGKKYLIFLFVLLVILVLAAKPALAAGEVSLSISAKSLTIYTGEIGSADISVRNNQASQDTFSISACCPYYGIIPDIEKYSLILGPNSNTTFKIYFSIPECAEETSTSFTITVKSLTNGDVEDSKSIMVSTIRRYGVCISDLKLDKYVVKPGENVIIGVSLSNPSESLSLPVSLQTNVIKDGEIVKRFDDKIETIEGKKTVTIEHIFSVEKYEKPGFYVVETTMKDRFGVPVTSKRAQFNVATLNASEDQSYLLIDKNIRYGLLAQTVEINVKNDGNVPIGNFYVTESIPIFMKIFFFPKTEPSLEEAKENRVVYSWLIPSLAPGENRVVSYDVSTWNAMLIIIIMSVVVAYAFKSIFAVSLVKRHGHRGPLTKEREVTVMLEVRNRTRNVIRDVIVRDFVPAVATVVEKFDTLRPTLRKVAGGTEILWTLPVLGPEDERVITYRIRPVLDITGTLKLPKAYARFVDNQKEVKKILSKSVFIKAG